MQYVFSGFLSYDNAFSTLSQLLQEYKDRPAIFGVDLEILTKREGRRIPAFIVETLDYIDRHLTNVQGIFRISASSTATSRVQNAIDRGEQIDWAGYPDPHLAPNLLKKFFRDLPTPLVPFDIYTCFITLSKTVTSPDTEPEIVEQKLKNALELMPMVNRMILARLLRFLKGVVSCSEQNMMGLTNIATIWGPLLLKSSEGNAEYLMNPESLSEVKDCVELVKLLIVHCDNLFEGEALRTKEKVSTDRGRYAAMPKVLTGSAPKTDTEEIGKDRYKVKGKYDSGVLKYGSGVMSLDNDSALRKRSTSQLLREKFKMKSITEDQREKIGQQMESEGIKGHTERHTEEHTEEHTEGHTEGQTGQIEGHTSSRARPPRRGKKPNVLLSLKRPIIEKEENSEDSQDQQEEGTPKATNLEDSSKENSQTEQNSQTTTTQESPLKRPQSGKIDQTNLVSSSTESIGSSGGSRPPPKKPPPPTPKQ